MSQYMQVLVALGSSVLLVAGLYVASTWLAVVRQSLRTWPFLSGGLPEEHAVSRFHVRWYPLPMLFLAFDMEMIFMYPWAVVVGTVGLSAVIEMFLFLSIILLGVAYAWREGALRWA